MVPVRLTTALMEELVTLDAQRAKLATKQGHAILDDAAALLAGDGVTPIEQKLRHGDLIETLTALMPEVRALVIGKRGEGSAGAFDHLGSNLERIIRSATVPVFVAAREFRPIQKVLIAYDGSASADRAVERMAQSPVFEGLRAVLVYAGADTPTIRSHMNAAQSRLAARGLRASIGLNAGEPKAALERKIATEGFDLLVMGAYQTLADFALHLITATAHHAALDERSVAGQSPQPC